MTARGPWVGLAALVLLLVASNAAAGLAYGYSHEGDTFWTQVWDYLDSDAFKVVTALVMLPIILLLLEIIFKIRNSVEERIRSERAREREKRLECIEQTIHIWNRLYALATEVIHFGADSKDNTTIGDLVSRLDNFRPECERVLNLWFFRFPNLSARDTDLFVSLMDGLHASSITVAYSIWDGDSNKGVQLQGCLGEIRDGITTVLYHPMVSILNNSTDVLDDGIPTEKKSEAKAQIHKEVNNLQRWVKELDKKKGHYHCFLPSTQGSDAEALREECNKLREWIREHPEQELSFSEEETERMIGLLRRIQTSARGYVTATSYSTEFVEHLAAWLAFETICQELEELEGLEKTSGVHKKGA